VSRSCLTLSEPCVHSQGGVDQQLFQRISAVDAQPAVRFIGIGLNDLEAVAHGVLQYRVGLALGRVTLVLGAGMSSGASLQADLQNG
jgi:hypothetical protein